MLGECVSETSGVSQPAIFEPIERAMALPTGRGEGTPPDDMFALGVTAHIFDDFGYQRLFPGKASGSSAKRTFDYWGKSIKEEAHALLVENGLLGANQPLGQANQNNN
jgi:hypothetical protein